MGRKRKNFKYKLLLTHDIESECSYIKTVTSKYFTKYEVGGVEYLVSKRFYGLKGEYDDEKTVGYSTLTGDSVYVFVDEWYMYLETYNDDMHKILSGPCKTFNDKVKRFIPVALNRAALLRKFIK